MREFVVSPGFVGAAVVVAALIVACAVLYAIRRSGKRLALELEQRERHHLQARDAEQQAATSQQCWQTLKWLVETAGIEPSGSEGATLGVGPELTMATLRGLLRDAERLEDETLADAVTAYQSQFALVLAQQGGPLSELAEAPPPATPPGGGERKSPAQPTPKEQPAKAQEDKPDAKPVSDEGPASAAEMVGDGRRHRR
jgi:hypothetical protein